MTCEDCKHYYRTKGKIGISVICRYDVAGTSEACRRFKELPSGHSKKVVNRPQAKIVSVSPGGEAASRPDGN